MQRLVRRDHLDNAHHARVLVRKNVAVEHKAPGKVVKLRAHYDLAPRRNRDSVLVTSGVDGLAVDADDLEWVDVNMNRMENVTWVLQHPLLRGPQHGRHIDAVFIKQLAI